MKPGKVLVISHERSGTHFLINSIARNFGYLENMIDLDYGGIEWSDPNQLMQWLRQYHDIPVPNIFKSHHPCEFLAPVWPYLSRQFRVFYLYRDGRDVMTSFWKFLGRIPARYNEGPITGTVGEFIRARPAGQICRYQITRSATMLERWVHHTNSWIDAAPPGLQFVCYEDLNRDFEHTVTTLLEEAMQIRAGPLTRPDMSAPSALPWKGKTGNYRDYFAPGDRNYFCAHATETMTRLGYGNPQESW